MSGTHLAAPWSGPRVLLQRYASHSNHSRITPLPATAPPRHRPIGIVDSLRAGQRGLAETGPHRKETLHEDRPLLAKWSRSPPRLLPRSGSRRRPRGNRDRVSRGAGRGARGHHRGGSVPGRQHPRLPRGRQREPGHADRDDGERAERQVPAGGPSPKRGAAARADRGSRQVHLHRPQLQGPRGRDQQRPAEGAAGVPQVGQRDPGSGRADPAAARGEDLRLGGGAGRGDRLHRPLREEGAGPRLRLRLHHHQRRQRARLPVPHEPVGRGQGGRHPGPGRPLHRGPDRDPGPARARPQDLGERHAHAERLHPQLHLRRGLHHPVPDQLHDPLAGRSHRHRHPRRGGLLAQAAGHAPAGRQGEARDHRPRHAREPGEGRLSGGAAMAVRTFLHYALEVPDQTVGQRFYEDFGLVDGTGSSDAVRLRPDRLGRDAVLLYGGARKRLHHLCYGAPGEDFARVRESLRRAGVREMDPPAGAPEGGVWIRDPDGNAVNIRDEAPAAVPAEPPVALNGPGYVQREIVRGYPERGRRIAPRKLGHVLLFTPDMERLMRFYTGTLGMKLSDRSRGIIAFLRCNTDHHTLALLSSHAPGFHHASFQVGTVDEIAMGAVHMAERGWQPGWGLGRHVIGSNFFYYLRDPWGSFSEYYYDLDYIPEGCAWEPRDFPPEDSLYVWGPPCPADFGENKEAWT